MFSRQKHKRFLQKLITSDEKLIYYENPKRRKHWVDPGLSTTSTQKRNVFGKKILIYIWWDEWDVLYYVLLKPGGTVTGKYYSLQLNHLAEKIEEKRPYTKRGHRPVKLQNNNAKPHRSSAVYQTINELRWGVLLHPAYSPDIAPCDYHLFRSLQNSLAEQQFQNEVEVRKIVHNFISSTDHTFFRCGIHQLPECWQRVVEVNGG